ncbi:multicopper oxidase family protein [Microbacterium pumilum]|uniref:Multicopper oxidase domain-containing protein n=1 Tax=Microbacterium pumilum TaxID=344165 RepID=A0ABN2SQ07_9MICO
MTSSLSIPQLPPAPVAPRPRRRRGLVGVLVAAPVVVVVATGAIWIATQTGRPTPPATGTVSFDDPLRIPPLADSLVIDGVRVFRLEAQSGATDFVSQGPTPTLGYNGTYLGPTLVAARGETVRVDVTNSLDADTTVHWHGMHLPAAMDGGPHSPIQPGATWHPEWTIDQPAATLWYHPHLHGETRAQVDAGLAGMFLLRDPDEAALALPRDYGVDDIPVIVQDRSFSSDGAFSGGLGMQFDGVLGDTVLVNGTPTPHLDVATERVRLRLLNGSSARMYDFTFADDRTFDLIATDGGLLEAPVPSTSIPLSPGERAEIVVTIASGERVALQSRAPDPALNAGAATFDVMQLRGADAPSPSPEVAPVLAELPAPDAAHSVTERSFVMSGHNINDRQMDMSRVDFTVNVDTSEVWTVRNENPLPHSFHVHDTQFRVLTIDGAAPPPRLAGWKDTIALEKDRVYRLLVTFDDYADPTTPYMYHCHLLWHEDQGMMGQFLVVEPGQQPALTTTEGETDDRHDH